MTKKSPSSVATKDDLKKLATKLELKKLEKSFNRKLENTELALMIRIEERAEKTERTLGEQIRISTNDLMTKIDSFMGKVVALKEDNTAGTDLIENIEVKVDDHEKRIRQLESPSSV